MNPYLAKNLNITEKSSLLINPMQTTNDNGTLTLLAHIFQSSTIIVRLFFAIDAEKLDI